MITTKNLHELLDIDELIKFSQSMSLICLILEDELQYWFNSKWSKNSMVFGMNNQQGEHFHILFNKYGAIILGFNHESSISSFRSENFGKLWKGLIESVPKEFEEAMNEPAFEPTTAITYCIWKKYTDDSWKIGDIYEFDEAGDDFDGSSDLFLLNGDRKQFLDWAIEYFGTFDIYDEEEEGYIDPYPLSPDDDKYLDMEIINHIFDHKPITKKLVKKMNPFIEFKDIKKGIEEIGYPIA